LLRLITTSPLLEEVGLAGLLGVVGVTRAAVVIYWP